MSNSKLAYSKSKAISAQRAASIKSAKIAEGTEVVVDEIFEHPDTTDRINRDELRCIVDGKRLRIPVREFMNMAVASGNLTETSESDPTGQVIFPAKFKIVKAEDRMATVNGKQETVYPLQAYNMGLSQIEAANKGDQNAFDFAKLVAGGLRPDHGLDPVQNYTIAVL
jgi:hypothetical protein